MGCPPELREGYYYLFPHRDHTRIGWGSLEKGRVTRQRDLVERFLGFWDDRGVPLDPSTYESWPIQVSYQGFSFGRVLLVGDAAGLPSSITGEGIYHALVSGEAIGRQIADGESAQGRLKSIIENKVLKEQ